MKIIHNNLSPSKSIPKVQEFDCDHCGSTIEVEPSDLHEGWLGALYFTCPVCGKESMTDIETELPTKDNIEFPKHFNHTCVDNGAVDVSDGEMQTIIRRLATGMWNCTNEMNYNTNESSTAFVFIENLAGDGEYRMIVCKDYWEGSVKANPNDKYYEGD